MINLGTLPLGELDRPSRRRPSPQAGRGRAGSPARPEQVEPQRAGAGGGREAALAAVIAETAALFRRLRAAAEELYGQVALSGARRDVLSDLAAHGPQTVPQLARARSVTRQHVQALVNPLVEAGYVELLDNPAHRRSRLVSLTPRGEGLVDEMNRRETEVLRVLEVAARDDDLERAVDALRAVREAFETRDG
ncbi:MAG: winged helix-turn-helix transcriptional regulator [Gemmatimonadota bacterium]|nr:MAG: winged helix-turn-helix transcriptional regulator [Gemmatimonadota bacterium]